MVFCSSIEYLIYTFILKGIYFVISCVILDTYSKFVELTCSLVAVDFPYLYPWFTLKLFNYPGFLSHVIFCLPIFAWLISLPIKDVAGISARNNSRCKKKHMKSCWNSRWVVQTSCVCKFLTIYILFFVAVHSRLAMSHSRAIVQARIVPVSSVGHTWTKKGIDFEDLNWEKRDYDAYEVCEIWSMDGWMDGAGMVMFPHRLICFAGLGFIFMHMWFIDCTRVQP